MVVVRVATNKAHCYYAIFLCSLDVEIYLARSKKNLVGQLNYNKLQRTSSLCCCESKKESSVHNI